MDYLEFRGSITTNAGRYNELVFPNSNLVPGAPKDWPGDKLFPGSLNVTIDEDGFPDNWNELGAQPKAKRLDDKRFSPAFAIPGATIKNNSLTPQRTGIADGGDAQVWRAKLQVDETGQTIDCWLVRRIGSGVKNYLELVSELRLRSKLALKDGVKVTVSVAGVLARNRALG